MLLLKRELPLGDDARLICNGGGLEPERGLLDFMPLPPPPADDAET